MDFAASKASRLFPVDDSAREDRAETSSIRSFGLAWLVRLRWVSLVGQLIVIALGVFWLQLQLPLGLLGGCLALTAISNLAVSRMAGLGADQPGWVVPAVLVLDIVILTVMLYFTGGAHNPFSSIYILYLTVAAMLLAPWMAWTAVALCGLAYVSLFQSEHYLINLAGERCCNDLDFHLTGMWVALVITGSGVAYFVTQLRADRERHRSRLARLRTREDQERRFAGLATLTAGVAHELATPLGTLAVIGKDLEKHAGTQCSCQECGADARLLRQEVDRCRAILDRMSGSVDGGHEVGTNVGLAQIQEEIVDYVPTEVLGAVEWHCAPDEEATVRIPRVSFLRALAILLTNAAEASPPDGAIRVEMERADRAFSVVVSDSGHGIPASDLHRVGEPFFTTKPPGSGMGLGLFIVRSLVETLEGEFAVDSTEGRGCAVSLHIPQAT